MDRPAILSNDLLTIYLNDHLAGATVGTNLAQRAAQANRGTEFEAPLGEIAEQIEQDHASLVAIFERLGRPRDRVKVAGGWLAERLGRLKANGRLRGYSPLSRLIELEGLAGGVQAKLALWRALHTVAPSRPGLDEAELLELCRRAEEQTETIERLHTRAAHIALAPQQDA